MYFGIRNLNITLLGISHITLLSENVEHRESQRRKVRTFLKGVIEIFFFHTCAVKSHGILKVNKAFVNLLPYACMSPREICLM